MKILEFEHNHFGVEDLKEILPQMGHSLKVVTTDLIFERISDEFDALFEKEFSADNYDLVFTFNYSVVVSQNCNRHGIKYVSWIYDSPLVALYSYTITNPCNYIFIFDSAQYLELKNGGIDTVYYMPLAVNVDRLDRTIGAMNNSALHSDISFVGSMYNEKHNLFDKLSSINPYTKGYLDAIMQAQLKVYGINFIEEMLTSAILNDLQKAVPYEPHKDGIETPAYIYANYFISRKLAQLERTDLLKAVSDKFKLKIFTHNDTPQLPNAVNAGKIDYYDTMPYVFNHSRINLNISLRSIKSGIPLRCMDIMGCGGFLLSNYQQDFLNHFVPDEDFVYFESKSDLINKCDYYLRHENERARIAHNGYEKVKEFHNYKTRLNEIFEIVFG